MSPFRITAPLVSSALLLTGIAPLTAPAAVAAVSAQQVAEGATSSPREAVNFNRDWKFFRQDVTGAEQTSFDDSAWGDIALPHAFDAPYDVGGDKGGQTFYVGVGWYRKTFDVPTSWDGKRLELDFEGSFQTTDIWVNGKHITTHQGGFTGFNVDISDAVHSGANEIAVKVDNTWQHDLAPRAGDHQFMGGIYRDVTLNVTDDVHVAWYGTFVTTPALTNPDWDTSDPAYTRNIDLSQYPSEDALQANLDAKRSNVRVQSEIQNQSSARTDVAVVQKVADPDGNVVATFESPAQTLEAGATATIDALSGTLDDADAMLKDLRLWSPTDPALYTVTTTVVGDSAADGALGDDARVLDTFDTTFGFRSAQYKKDGFYLNGSKTLLYGADAHQDQGGWGSAVVNTGFSRDVSMLKEAGMNFIRGSHYPHDPAYLDATDALGMMYWSEGVFWGMGGQSGKDADPIGAPSDWLRDAYPQNPADEAAFEQSAMDAITAMIRVDRNHPSVINWSMGNEVFFTADATQDKAKALVSKMRDLAHSLDPTRKAGMGGVQRGGFDQLSVSDIAGYNGDGGRMRNTWMPNLVAEYASHTSDRPGSYGPFYSDIQDPSDDQSFLLQQNSAGLALWAGFDHGTVGGPDLARMGMIDYNRLPKQQWYWYRANKDRWTNQAIVADPTPAPIESSVAGTASTISLAPSKYSSDTITDDGRVDTQLEVTLKNAAGAWVGDQGHEVTLTVTSGPGIFPGGKTYKLTPGTTLFDGKGAIAFRSYYAGVSTITATADSLPDATLTITTKDVVGNADQQEPANFGDASLWGSQVSAIPAPVAYDKVNKALSRPLSVSSEADGAGKALAADGNAQTAWKAAADGSGQWISSFLEVTQNVYKIGVDFAGADLPYTLELQKSDGSWTTVASYTNDTVITRPAEESVDGAVATSVRVSFPNLDATQRASLAELRVYGNDAAQSPDYAADSAYVSDLLDYAADVSTGYGNKVKDRSADGAPIRVGGVTYDKGVGLHADSQASLVLDGRYSRLLGVAGIDDETNGQGDATFEIFADGQKIFSETLTGGTSAPIDLSVSGVKRLTFVTGSNGSNGSDHTDWADLRVLGAPRDVSSGSAVTTTFTGSRDQLRAGEPYRASVTVVNRGQQTRGLTAGVAIYDVEGQLQELRTAGRTVDAGTLATLDVVVPVGDAIAGGYATVNVWDSATMEKLSAQARVSANPGFVTVSAGDPAWSMKIDGESTELKKTDTWENYPSSSAYDGTETFTATAGSTMEFTFTGQYVRVGAKFDGSQTGFDVYVDDVKVDTVSTRADGNAYDVAWTSAALGSGSHTVRLVSAGKIGIDYFELGIVPEVDQQPEPAYHDLLQVVGTVLGLINGDAVVGAPADARAALVAAFDSAYTTYRNADGVSYAQAADNLQKAIDALTAVAPTPEVTVSAATVQAGSQLTVTGSGFAEGDQVGIVLHSEPVSLGSASVGSDGQFSTVVTIPATVDVGKHIVIVTADPSGRSARVPLSVTDAPNGGTTGGGNPVAGNGGGSTSMPGATNDSSSNGLALTGANAAWGAAALAMLVSALGVGLVIRARRPARARR